VALLEHLIGKGRQVRVYDPHIRLEEIYGSNQQFVLAAIPHIANLLESKLESMLEWADHVIVTQRPAAAVAEVIERSGVPVLDIAGGAGAPPARDSQSRLNISNALPTRS
jgi:GDP-mannose 6-dehydrogenase